MGSSNQGWSLVLVLVAACGGARSSAGETKSAQPIYAPLFRLGQTWEFAVELVEEGEEGGPSRTTALPPQHCTVANVHAYLGARVATVACEPSDPDPELTQRPAIPFAGRVLATPAGLWRWPEGASEGGDQPLNLDELDPKEMLVPAALAQLHHKVPQRCLSASPPPDELHSLLPWDGAWCATVVWGCVPEWSTQCFRPNAGWIGGAWHGYPDPATPRWQEVRWGQAPAYPFGTN